MIIVCKCGVKSRVRDIANANRVQCSKCKTLLHDEANRQAARNADIVLEVAALLNFKDQQGLLSKEDELIGTILARHEVTR